MWMTARCVANSFRWLSTGIFSRALSYSSTPAITNFIQKGYVGSFNYGPNVKLPVAPNPKDKKSGAQHCGQRLTTDTISTRLIHYFNDDWSMNAGVGWQQADRAMRSVSSKILNNQGDISRSDEGFHRCRTFSRPEQHRRAEWSY